MKNPAEFAFSPIRTEIEYRAALVLAAPYFEHEPEVASAP
jgi:antitoxin component HigA of HigAB toxin-antitoxin module